MDESKIRSQITSLQNRLSVHKPNNKVGRHVKAIRSSLEKGEKREDPVAEKRRKSLTNHEIGSASNPIEEPEKDSKDIHIPNEHIEELDRELRSIINELEQLSSDVSELDPDGLSNSLRSLHEGLFGVQDDLSFALLGRGDEPQFREHAEIINRKVADFEEDVQNLQESLDRIEDEFEYARSQLGDLSVPSRESVEEEVQKTRSERAKREFEEMKPYMDMRRIRREFAVGEVFTPKDLADKVDVWTESTAESCIEDAKEVGDHGEAPEIKKVGESQYKLVEQE